MRSRTSRHSIRAFPLGLPAPSRLRSSLVPRFDGAAERVPAMLNVSDFFSERLKHNLTLVNSNWTAGKLSECYAIGSTTLYPPVPGEFPAVPWAEREDGFVCIGRFSPEKELEKVIDDHCRGPSGRPECAPAPHRQS